MKITYETNKWRGIAEEGMALCLASEEGPTRITEVVAPLDTPTSMWKDCEYGPIEPTT